MSELLPILLIEEAQQTILRRRGWDAWPLPASVRQRLAELFGREISPEAAVAEIIADVRRRGDAALREWALKVDGLELPYLEVPEQVFVDAYDQVQDEVISALEEAAERIRAFHLQQPVNGWIEFDAKGTVGQIVRPLRRVGVYAPGGTAPLPSTILMTALPAAIAGVEHVVVITPPQKPDGTVSPLMLVAADLAGVETVYVSGGAQAIAALAYGTETVPAVDKIVGPGNIFVTLAKRQVYGTVGIDGLLGPTETVVIADGDANPAYVAADLLAQAEHDILATAILLTPDRKLAEAVQAQIEAQLAALSRAEIIRRALAGQGGIVLTEGLNQAVDLANDFAPEHLCLLTSEPWALVNKVQNAGGIFLGEHSFEVLGDYVAGPSHSMPTGGSARFASPVNLQDFVKIISLVAISEEGMAEIGPIARTMAEAEGLTAHATAVEKRIGRRHLTGYGFQITDM